MVLLRVFFLYMGDMIQSLKLGRRYCICISLEPNWEMKLDNLFVDNNVFGHNVELIISKPNQFVSFALDIKSSILRNNSQFVENTKKWLKMQYPT